MNKEKNDKNLEKKIKLVLERIKLSLKADGGDLEFVKWNEATGILEVRLKGACACCPMSQITLKEGVEATIRLEIPEVNAVIGV